MTDREKIIGDNPIGNGLGGFRSSFVSLCKERDIAYAPDASELPLDQLDQEDIQTIASDLIIALASLPASRLLSSSGRKKNLRGDLLRLIPYINDDTFDADRITALLKTVLSGDCDDTHIWNQAYRAVAEETPPPQPLQVPILLALQQTPWNHNTSSFANSSEYRRDVDRVLREELGAMYVGLPRFHEVFFGDVAGLEAASEAVFEKCQEGDSPLFDPGDGWRGWPKGANQDDVLDWFTETCNELAALAEDHNPNPSPQRRPLVQPNTPVDGSTAQRKLDVGFVKDQSAGEKPRHTWSQILVPGELKSNPSDDKPSGAWVDLGRYAREVLAVQDTRRYVLGFTLCGSLMRVWEFDRLGAIASEEFDINKDDETGLRFVSTILGFLWMDEEQLGFDPTIISEGDKQIVTIQRDGKTERLILDELIKRAPCVSGRATTCWKAHPEEDPQMLLVIKDSWQYTERNEEGELLKEATDQGVVNVARYYHHETVHVRSQVDEIHGNIRRGLISKNARTYQLEPSSQLPDEKSKSGRTAGVKRSPPSQADGPPGKRSRSMRPVSRISDEALANRVHRRVIVRDYGKAIYKASTIPVLLKALEDCIQGHESLHKAGILHRDISVNNLMLNEDRTNPSWSAFLIDCDLAIKEQRLRASGAKAKTGTRAFMAVGALLGKQHSFMHDLESFFWVLFWLCIHSNGPDRKGRVVPEFDQWNFASTEGLAKLKMGTVGTEEIFMRTVSENSTPYHQRLIPLLSELRVIVFPNGHFWDREDEALYGRMRGALQRERERLDSVKT
ncbi:hypothetical protein GGI42DRAFT_351039 [Trichoderma sp. SZMC 28013]